MKVQALPNDSLIGLLGLVVAICSIILTVALRLYDYRKQGSQRLHGRIEKASAEAHRGLASDRAVQRIRSNLGHPPRNLERRYESWSVGGSVSNSLNRERRGVAGLERDIELS